MLWYKPYKHYDHNNGLNYKQYVAWNILNKTYYTICIYQVLMNKPYVAWNIYNIITNQALWQYDVGIYQGL